MRFPPGRIGTADLYRRTGITKSTFFRNFRNNPHWRRRLDIREDPRSGALTFSEEAVTRLAEEFRGNPAVGTSRRARNLYRDCPSCAELVKKGALVCKHCGRDVPAAAEI